MNEIMARARRAMPGGAFTTYVLDDEVDFVVKYGKGSKVYSTDGTEYIDCVNGSGPMLIGHAHPEVVEAMKVAVESPSNYYLLNEKGIELAETLVESIPCAEQIKYGVTGSDATLYAMRLARAFTGRSKILKFEGGFLGGNDYALMSMSPASPFPNFPAARPDSAGIPPVLQDEVLIAPYNDLEAVTQIVAGAAGELAAIIVEAQQRCIDPKPGFLEGLRSLCDANGILLIFDEVVTGYRLAWGGAQERYNVRPDLATYGKVIGGGMPLSAVAGREEIMRLANPRSPADPRKCFTGSTTCGNPVAATAGIATLAVLSRPGTYDRLNEIGDRFRNGAAEIFQRRGVAGQTLGSGPLTQIVLTDVPVIDYRTSVSGDLLMQRKLTTALVRGGVLTHGKFYFSLALSNDDIDRVLSVLDEAVASIF
ncbi:aspartate aminotransferase family protein [Ensifer sp. ENS07]|uniref:aspartate aminotransferase family protein n=1 Tax=Ensifer sp. ENS07 TaxID=2769274 RepID=UPI00177AB1CB|nr:aspartate aminotransferase family protein [Ensifer sp. ENS07]MBD9638784.1 aspartate aminotransferase family protein [Ensifer sp. ENS07]